MRRIVVTEFVSLDGVMEDPGWTFEFNRGPDGDKFKNDELFASEAMLLGRVTYQGFAQAWPTMEGTGAYGERMNSMPKYVVSNTLTDAEAVWDNTTVIRGDVPAEVARLKEQPGGDLLVHGSRQLAQALIQHGLADEFHLMVFPTMRGGGRRLYPDGLSEAARLTLTDSRTAGDGVLLLTYQLAPAKPPGSSTS